MKKISALCLSLLLSFTSLLGCSSDEISSLGVIGGADGPTTIVVGQSSDDKTDGAAPDIPDIDDAAPIESSSSVVTVSDGKPVEWNGEPLSDAVVGVQSLTAADFAGIEKDGWYSSKEEVALYYKKYGVLPDNYITKQEARALGWEGGALEDFAPGQSIGGDYFGNYEGALPSVDERAYIECDIDTVGRARGAKRLIFSNDGLAFYTDDHYETFTLLTDATIQKEN